MNSIDKIRICKTRNVKTPTRGTSAASGLDCYVPYDMTIADMEAMFDKTGHVLEYETGDDGFVTQMTIGWGESACIPSGIKAELPHGYCMEFHDKSGVAMKRGLIAGAKLIDSDYQGVWHIDLHNVSKIPAVVKAGDKIAQFVMYKTEYPDVEVVPENELFKAGESERGEGAFGSTGER